MTALLGPATIPPFSKMTKRTRGCFYHAFELERLDAQRQVLLDRILWDEDGWPYVDKLEPSYGAFRPVIK